MTRMYLNSIPYPNLVSQICRNLEHKIENIKVHTCNLAWMSITIFHNHICKLQMPAIIRYKNQLDTQVVSSDTAIFAELAMMIHQLRDIYLDQHLKTKILPYDQQFQTMVTTFQQGMDKNTIISKVIDYIVMISEDLKRKGISLKIASKKQLLEQYMREEDLIFEELARIMENIRKGYENQGYIVQLSSYEEELESMKSQLSRGESKQNIILKTLNRIEDAKKRLARNGVSTILFPNQEALEKYCIGQDKDYIELAQLCDEIYHIYTTYGLSTPILNYENQLQWIQEEEKNGKSKENIMRQLISMIEHARTDLQNRNITTSIVSKDQLLQRYSIVEDATFMSLAEILDRIRTFYLTHRLNTQLLPYDLQLKVMKEAYEEGIPEESIIRTSLRMIEEARMDLTSKGYPIALPSKEELFRQFDIQEDSKQL